MAEEPLKKRRKVVTRGKRGERLPPPPSETLLSRAVKAIEKNQTYAQKKRAVLKQITKELTTTEVPPLKRTKLTEKTPTLEIFEDEVKLGRRRVTNVFLPKKKRIVKRPTKD